MLCHDQWMHLGVTGPEVEGGSCALECGLCVHPYSNKVFHSPLLSLFTMCSSGRYLSFVSPWYIRGPS